MEEILIRCILLQIDEKINIWERRKEINFELENIQDIGCSNYIKDDDNNNILLDKDLPLKCQICISKIAAYTDIKLLILNELNYYLDEIEKIKSNPKLFYGLAIKLDENRPEFQIKRPFVYFKHRQKKEVD